MGIGAAPVLGFAQAQGCAPATQHESLAMPAPTNTLKARLAAKDITYGIWVGLADPYSAEIAAQAGFDWLLLDGEHAPNDIRSLSAQLAVVEPSGSVPVVRLPDDDPAKIKQALDIGAQTLLIPMVDNAAQAQRVISACLYPPEGIRGVGAALARASRFGSIADYQTTANDEICIMVQVESRAGLAALDDILALDRLDSVFIGPSDLAADMGLPGQLDHPDLRAAVSEALRKIRAAGKAPGILTTEPDFIAEAIAAGALFVGVGIDVTTLSGALRALAAQYQTQDQTQG